MPKKNKSKSKHQDFSSDDDSENELNYNIKNKNKNNRKNNIKNNNNFENNNIINNNKKLNNNNNGDNDNEKLKIKKFMKNLHLNDKNENYSDGDGQQETFEEIKELSYTEILFWKIFKNQYLLNSILNNFNLNKFKIDSFKYDQIKSVQWLLRNRYYELLKLKVKRSEYLVDFYENLKMEEIKTLTYRSRIDDCLDIKRSRFSIFKEIQNDINFFENLYSNYSQYFIKLPENTIVLNETHAKSISPTSKIPNDAIELTKKLILKYDNISALIALLRNYKPIITIEDFYESVSFGSIKCSKYLIEKNYLNFKKNDIIVKLWKSSILNQILHKNDSDSIDSQDEPQPQPQQQQQQQQQQQDYNNINLIVKYLILDLKFIPPKELNKVSEDIFKFEIYNLTIKELFESCETISLLLENTNFFNDYLKSINKKEIRDKYQNFEEILVNYLPNPKIDFIKFNQLQDGFKNQLNNIWNEKVYSISKENHLVEDLFRFLITFTCYKNYYRDNFIYYQYKYLNDFSLLTNKFNSLYFGSIKNLRLRQILYQTNEQKQMVGSYLFKYSGWNSLKNQKEFLDEVIENIKQQRNEKLEKENRNIFKCNVIMAMEMLLIFNNLDLLKLFFNELVLINSDLNECFPKLYLIDLFCKSLDCFDWLIGLNLQVINNQLTLENCLKSQLKLLNHIKLNHKELYKQILVKQQQHQQDTQTIIDYSKESLLFIYKNMNDFEFIYNRIEIWKRWNYFQSIQLDEFKQIVNGTPFNKKYNFQCFTFNDSMEYKKTCELIDWIYQNKYQDIENGRCDGNYGKPDGSKIIDSNLVYLLYHYYINQMDVIFEYYDSYVQRKQISKIQFIQNAHNQYMDKLFVKLRYLIASRGDIENLDKLFKWINYYPNNKISMVFILDFFNFIAQILVIAQINGQLSVFDYIKENHGWILNYNLLSDFNDFHDHYQDSTIVNLDYMLKSSATINGNIEFFNIIKKYIVLKGN